MVNRKRFYIVFIVVSTLLIGFLHYSTPLKNHALHNIQTELHYIPLLLAAIVFGLRGAILTFMAIIALYLPYLFATLTDPFFSIIDRLLQILFSGFIAFLAGFFVDRERKYREQSEKDRYLAGIGEAATAIVHDLKNPLITIIGFARRIQEGKGSLDKAVQAITGSAQNMQKIVFDVLDFAKQIRLNLREEDIGGIFSRAYDACKTKAKAREVPLSIDLPADPTSIVIDRFQMERALVNLINNAIDASGKGEKVTIGAVPKKNYLVVRIKDNGSGMDKKTLENIFVPFYTEKREGTGLGMPIAKKIIDAHQGKIRIDSQPGVGTEMIIELPYRLMGKKQDS